MHVLPVSAPVSSTTKDILVPSHGARTPLGRFCAPSSVLVCSGAWTTCVFLSHAGVSAGSENREAACFTAEDQSQ